jgi:hypothetical protein
LRRADLAAALFTGLSHQELTATLVFTTDVAGADLSASAIRVVRADQVKFGDEGGVTPLIPSDVDAWIAAATKFASLSGDTWIGAATQFASDKDKMRINNRFLRLRADFREDTQQATWLGIQEASLALDPDGSRHRQRLAILLGDLVCTPEGAPYVARRLVGQPDFVDRGRLVALGDQLAAVRDRMTEGRKTPEKCPGVSGFTENDWRALDAIKPIEPAPTNH